MKAFILAAGLGTRLKPWTLSHPKALVPVGGIPMLERVIRRLESEGFSRIAINIHHFGEQIIEFVNSHSWQAGIMISDERTLLLDTGGALVGAASLLCHDEEPVLVHNVDILSDAPLASLMRKHTELGADATLLVSDRNSSRRLLFDDDMNLRGWLNRNTGETRGELNTRSLSDAYSEQAGWPISLAFSGIHVLSPSLIRKMTTERLPEVFPIMDFYLSHTQTCRLKGYRADSLSLIDIGKPETLSQANTLFQ